MRTHPAFNHFALMLLSVACWLPATAGKSSGRNNRYERHLNFRYGDDTTQQTLDYYLPARRDKHKTPIIILLHGGAWITGDKNDFADLGADTVFTNAGFAAVNMNYRLCDKYKYPAPVQDISLVLKLIRKEHRHWHVDHRRIALLGRSAGGQLALLYAYTHKEIKAVVECCAPTDLADSSVVSGPLGVNVTNWLGTFSQHTDLWNLASPLRYVAHGVPTLVLHGDQDNLVVPSQTHRLIDSLGKHHIPAKLIHWPESGHGWNIPKWPADKEMMFLWLRHYL